MPEIEPAAAGSGFTEIAKLGDTVPSPHELCPLTVRMPELAVGEKLIVIDAIPPETVVLPIVAPVPEYDQV